MESEVSVEESCIYTMTPDENPVIDLVPDTNIVIAVGFSGIILFWNKSLSLFFVNIFEFFCCTVQALVSSLV